MPAKNGTGGALFEKAVAGMCTQPFFYARLLYARAFHDRAVVVKECP
jgi:hypothetical protein